MPLASSSCAGLDGGTPTVRWRRTFMTEVFESLLRLGLRACPVCGSAESLSMSPFPAILVDGEFPLDPDALPEEEGGDLTFAVRIECTTCGHLMLFNAQRHRTGDARILEDGITEDERPLQGRPARAYKVVRPVRLITARSRPHTAASGPGAASDCLLFVAGCAGMLTREVRRARRLSRRAIETGAADRPYYRLNPSGNRRTRSSRP